MRFQGFVGPTYQSRSVSADCQRTVNLYPEMVESGTGKSQAIFHAVPGLATFTTLPKSPVRGIHEMNGTVLAAAGAKLYRVYSDGTYTDLGSIQDGTDPVQIASNGAQFFICSGGVGYLWNGSTLTVAGQGSPSHVVFVDGYFVAFDSGTQKFYISELYDGATWSALDFASVESDPDLLVSLIADHRELWMFGSRSVEVFVNTGNVLFPFERIQGAVIEQGCGAANSVAKLDNSIFWLGSDVRGGRMLWRANGYTPVRVSNHAVEAAWAGYTSVSDAYAFPYVEQGHAFYQITFPSAHVTEYPHGTVTVGATWVYDAATGQWHERGLWDSTLGDYRQHRGLSHCYVWEKHLIGDRTSGVIHQQSLNTYLDSGSPLRWERTAPHVSSEGNRLFFSRLRVDLETGQGLTTGQGSDPQIGLRFSDDGGRTWSNERLASMGKMGEFRKRVEWNRLGMARDRVFRVSGSDPVKTSIVDAYLTVEAGQD